jgi:hypothetical protein
MNRMVAIAGLMLALASACARDDGQEGGREDWTTEVDTIGDTVVIRTTGASDSAALHTLVAEVSIGELEGADEYTFGAINEVEVAGDGRIYVFDRQVPALREYDAAGKFVRTLGRKGAGPGEYTQANGVAVHRDGRIVLWDAGTAHINVYGQDGAFITSWPLPGGAGFYTSGALFVDTAGNTYARTRIADPPATTTAGPRIFGTTGLVKWDRDGRIVDSLTPPPATIEPPTLVASVNGGTAVYSLPFAPGHVWAWSPLGYFVSAQTDRYAVNLISPQGNVQRIERQIEAVPVSSEERADVEEQTTASLRMTDPKWRWSGPAIPAVKPFIRTIAPADDGRLWVSVAQPGERIPAGELAPPPSVQIGNVDPERRPQPKWRDPTAYDVFDANGRYLGRVAAPAKTTFKTMRGDHIWAVARDSLDVQQVVRFRVVPGFADQKTEIER